MRGLILSVAAAALCLGGCAPRYGDTSLYQSSGRQKAIVAVLPVIDKTAGKDLPWDLSQELTDEIRKRVYESKQIYLLRDGGTIELAQQMTTPNPQDISTTIVDQLGSAEYAIVTEIVAQAEKPVIPGHAEKGGVLDLEVRLRVVDLRKRTPRVILQEVLGQEVVIAGAYMNYDYSQMAWGTESFNRTPLGMAHQRLVRDLVSRAEAYIETTR